MNVDLEQNPKLQRFIELTIALNQMCERALRTGDMEILSHMNDVIDQLFSIQHGNEAEEYTAIEEEMQAICENFNEIVVALAGGETESCDEATSAEVEKFLHNIFDVSVRIMCAYLGEIKED